MPTDPRAWAALAIGGVIVAVIFWLIARDDDECDELHFTFLPDDDATDDIWDLAAGLGYDDGWCGRCGRHITECRADGACEAATARYYCPRHSTDTISLFEVPDGWMPPTGARRIAAIADYTQALEVVSVGSPAA